MVVYSSVAAAAAALLLARPAQAGLYSSGSPVLDVNAKTYDRHIAQSNYTSLVEFYAPWCGHCKNLQPAYEKTAKSLKGLAKVAAVNCDDEMNKGFCGSMGIKGFPTLKLIRPGKKRGRPIVEEYQGGRTAKAMVDSVIEKIPNHVDKLTSAKMEDWLKASNETSKAILFTKKGATSALYRSLAIDFLGSITFGQVRDTEAVVEDIFGVTEFPKLVLLPGGDADSIVYDGEMKKEAMLTFLSQLAKPNPDPAPEKPKVKAAKKDKKTETKNKEKAKKAADAEKARDKADFESGKKEQKVVKEDPPPVADELEIEKTEANTEKPESGPPALPTIESTTDLRDRCFNPTAGTCLIVLMPDVSNKDKFSHSVVTALSSLSQIHHSYKQRQAAIFPFWVIPGDNEVNSYLRGTLKSGADSTFLKAEALEILIVNAKRGWWRRYRSEVDPESGFGVKDLEGWIDHVKSGAGIKQRVPEDAVAEEGSTAEKIVEKASEIKDKIVEAVVDAAEKVVGSDSFEETVEMADDKAEVPPPEPGQTAHEDL